MQVLRSRHAWKVEPIHTAPPIAWAEMSRTAGQIVVLGVLGGLCGLMGGMLMLRTLAYYS